MSTSSLLWKHISWIFLLQYTLVLAVPEPSSVTNINILRTAEHIYTNPKITEHPVDDYFAKNEPATLNCKAEGDPSPVITWYKDGEPVETNRENPMSHRMLLDNGQLFFLRVIHNKNNQADIGKYYCNATNKHGSAISRTATIQIAVLKDEFRVEPSDATASVGQSVTLHCRPPRGKPDPKVIWRKNGEPVHSDDRIQITEEGDLVIKAVVKQDIGEYLCLAINTGGEKESRPAHFRVLDIPMFNKLPKDVAIEEGVAAEFYCDVTGDLPIKVQWSKEGQVLNLSRARILADRTLRIEKVTSEDEGVYVCSAENAAGATKATARLVVYSSPSFLLKPRDQVVERGRTVSLQCVARGNPPPTVFWSKESQENLMFANRDSGGRYTVAEDGTLRIEAVNDTDVGVYICEALNTKGQASASARVQVIAHDTRPPPIIKIGPQNQTVTVGAAATMHCVATGKPDPIIRWYKNGRPLLMTDPRITVLDSGALQISDLKIQDSATYACKAVSETGETTWDAFLMVSADIGKTIVKTVTTSMLPDPPSKPIVSQITNVSVHLSWHPGNQKDKVLIESYYVEYYGYDITDGWVVINNNVKRESYTVEKLCPNTTYIFLVRGVNAYGIGLPSPITGAVRTLAQKGDASKPLMSEEKIKQELSESIVELMNTQSVNSSAISLTWMITKASDNIDGFQIKYRHITDIRRLEYGDTFTVYVSSAVKKYTLTGLSSYSWYEICVLAYSGNLQSRCSSPVKVQTEEMYLPGPPENVIVHKVSEESLSILWSPPGRKHGQISLNGYQILCESIDKTDNCSVTTNGQTTNAVISRLKSGTCYKIQVAAETHKGLGAWSQPYIINGTGVYLVRDLETIIKLVADEERSDGDLFKKTWFVGLLIGVGGVMLWFFLCAFSIWLCRRKRHRKKLKDQRFYSSVPMHKSECSNRNTLYPPQYGVKNQNTNCTNDLDLPPEHRVFLPIQGIKETDITDDNIYRLAGDGSFPHLKTFYQNIDPVAPYATTALIQQQHLLRQQGFEHMFRPIPDYQQHKDSSADSCQKPAASIDSNPDHSTYSHTTIDHNHSDHMSPTSDSGSHSTDENGLLIKKKCKSRKESNPKQPVDLADVFPPPPKHPPPCDYGEPSRFSEMKGDNRSNTHSPMSSVSFSQLSACSCPNPHTQTPVSGWNVPVYSDNECPRCHSEKYFDPVTYCQEAFMRHTNSPRTHIPQHVNNNNNRNTKNLSCSPRGTPVGNASYQFLQPQMGYQTNCNALHGGDIKSNMHHASHSDNEIQNVLPDLQSYKMTPKSEDGGHGMEWCVDPAPSCHNCRSRCGMGTEDGPCIDRACQSSLLIIAPSVRNTAYHNRSVMCASAHGGYRDDCESPTSDVTYGVEDTDLEESQEHTDTDNCNIDHKTDSSSVRSSTCSSRDGTCSSGDGTFLTEEDFASAVAHAAEMSGLTVVGTTVCDVDNKKKEHRQRRQARAISPGYSTDSNYGSIDMVRKPYPKAQRRQQLLEQGKGRSRQYPGASDMVQNTSYKEKNQQVSDNPYTQKEYPQNIAPHACSPMLSHCMSSQNRMSPLDGRRSYDRGSYSSYILPQKGVAITTQADNVLVNPQSMSTHNQ